MPLPSLTRRPLRPAFLALAALLAAGCATGPQANPDDPLEPMNRVVFKVNDKLDQYVATPVAKGYKAVTPQPVRTAVTNFYSNIADVGNFANNLLQGKGVDAAESLMRVAINSVLGIGGLIDIATPAGLQKHSQDFGLTLGTWGVPSGPYLVLPFFGPSSFRDGVGLYVNFQFDPTTYMDPAWRNSLFAMNVVDVRTNLLGATDLLSLAALDKYAFVRDAYVQRRRYLLDGGSGKLPNYGDDEETEGAAMPAPSPASAPAAEPAVPAAPASGAPQQ
ncbi:Intermembrane phospholipid transport system lipoprotein MlaA [Cupriavidus yeoncheonensis]|uniref:Intermembrane phospholipid transport system lipoprotein MlaA n=1 Tax=Cupriavidus yeoncheonensis TaxID=1462994 RepID=A0A916MUD7_9BURK|nr:VacJ family lipoprotein [Cupriavidus yeoncheonensis]CAG2136405.1 Intermembrane phospholipid transport system lipoprotein MlaA [Cupriavidus yeoncheonensis]